jgi:hypothetical protein
MKRLLLLLLLSVMFRCVSAQSEAWYKGNLHTHSYWSDGDEFPELIMDWYKNHGYQFVGLSDHNTLAAGEKWKMIAKSRLYADSFAKYLEKYGTEWVTYKVDSGRTLVRLKTLAEYRPLFEDENFLMIQSEEITSRFENKPIHMNATNIQTIIGPQSGNSVTEVMQRTVDAVLKQRAETGVPMIAHVNHPNFGFGVSVQDMIDLKGERFFEVYNGHPYVNNYGDSLHPGMEELWDRINIAYLDRAQPVMYGLATDDSHNYHQFGKTFSNSGRGWVMVKAKALTPEALIEALESGQFYSTTGVTLDRVSYENHTLTVVVKPEDKVEYTLELIGVLRGQQKPAVLKKITGTKARFTVTNKHLFVRARITSTKKKDNPYQEGDVEMAWTQPVTY